MRSPHPLNFQPLYQTSYYSHESHPQAPPAPPLAPPLVFRNVVFADVTSSTVNATTSVVATGQKRKSASQKAPTSKRRNLGQPQSNLTTIAVTSNLTTTDPTSTNPHRAALPVPDSSHSEPETTTPSAARHQDQPTVYGVGPQRSTTSNSAAATGTSDHREVHPSFTRTAGPNARYGSLLHNPLSSSNTLAHATDVWYFMRGLMTDIRPESALPKENPSVARPNPKEFSFIGCILCSHDEWTTWKNTDGQTKTIRKHLKSKHLRVWRDIVILMKLKGWKELGLDLENDGEPLPVQEHEPWCLEGFYDRLVKWIAVDDQSMDVVDCPELRDLLLYLRTDLKDGDIPHRTKLSELITKAFQREYQAMLRDLENSLGRISFTTDIWSRENLESYMGVTAHYCAKTIKTGHLVCRTRLVAFRRLLGSHSGSNIGQAFLRIMKEIGCLQKLSMITTDNASNNNTMMEELETELLKIGIPFDRDGNRIRCFPHVINLAVKAGLKHLTFISAFDPDILDDSDTTCSLNLEDNSGTDNDPAIVAYREALQSDVVASARRLVTAVRASGQRREEFEGIIREGNASGGWQINSSSEKFTLRVVGLLKDMDVRWSSTFIMIDRFLEMYPAIKVMVFRNTDLTSYTFTEHQLHVLTHVRRFLWFFHVVQELVSAERTPTLSIVLPMYEKLIVMLRNLKKELPGLAHAINASVDKLEEYLALSRRTKIYILAMVLHPTVKLQWLAENWSTADYCHARRIVIDVLLEYRQDLRKQGNQPSQPLSTPSQPVSRRIIRTPSASQAAQSQQSGYARFTALERSFSEPSATSTPNDNSTPTVDPIEAERQLAEEDRRLVTAELKAYEDAGVYREGDKRLEDFDLLRFWQANQGLYPLLWKVALDVLPAQASAVPCERVFSSSKQTDTSRRSNLSSFKMEELQILKFGYRSDRLTFTDELICTDQELSVLDLSVDIVEDLLADGKLEELHKYIEESWEGWGSKEVES